MRRNREVRDTREREQAQGAAAKLVAAPVQVSARAGEGGRLFGSVTASDIAGAIDPADLVSDREVAPSETQPLLIRTTGTTGVPKGARHDWAVLSRRVADAVPRPDQRWLLTYGLHQFAGVQMLLHVVSAQATLVAPFPRQPRDGAAALLNHGVTCVSATPTYWRFLLAHARSAKPYPATIS